MINRIINFIAHIGYKITTIGLTKGPHITRFYMYHHLSKYSETRPEEHRVLSIAHSEELGNLLGYDNNQITNIEYPDGDILNLPFEAEEFDAVVCDQVLEHVAGNPFLAISETFRVLKRGGVRLTHHMLHKSNPRGSLRLLEVYAGKFKITGWRTRRNY